MLHRVSVSYVSWGLGDIQVAGLQAPLAFWEAGLVLQQPGRQWGRLSHRGWGKNDTCERFWMWKMQVKTWKLEGKLLTCIVLGRSAGLPSCVWAIVEEEKIKSSHRQNKMNEKVWIKNSIQFTVSYFTKVIKFQIKFIKLLSSDRWSMLLCPLGFAAVYL